jgi:hypothetical protein
MKKRKTATTFRKKLSANNSIEPIAQSILSLRGYKVLLDSNLAALYKVETKVLLQAVKRNFRRFPEDFMLQLTASEWEALRSQIVTLKPGRGQQTLVGILKAIREIMNPPASKRRPIGFIELQERK